MYFPFFHSLTTRFTDYFPLSQVLLCAILATPVMAQEVDPHELVRQSVARVLDTLEDIRSETQSDDPEVDSAMTERVVNTLSPLVDFDGIARAVMGGHAASASDEQISEFSRTFRTTMTQLYLRSLLNLEIQDVRVEPPGDGFDPSSGRANVAMTAVVDGGQEYSMRYSMRTDTQGEWRILNIIVEGVNIGLTYMNQFNSAMQRRGDIDAVIDQWQEEARSVDSPGSGQ